MSTDPAPKSTTTAWDDVRRLADEVRLKMHLAGMELKDQWTAFEPQLHEVERKLKETGEKAEGVVATQIDHLAVGLRKLADELRGSFTSKP